MDTKSLKTKLQKTINTVRSEKESSKETNPIKAWLSSRTPSVDLAALAELVKELRNHPELIIFDDKMQVLENSRYGVDYDSLGNWLVFRALQVGTDNAIADLERYVNNSHFEYYQTMALSGIQIEDELQFTNGIKLVPLSSIPDTIHKVMLENFMSPFGTLARPSTALIRTLSHPRIHLSSKDDLPRNTNTLIDWRREFEDVRLCLTLIGPSSSIDLGSWVTFVDWVPCASPGWSPSLIPHTMQFIINRRLDPNDYDRARGIHDLFLKLNLKYQEQLRVSLSRLNSAILQSPSVSSAIDLRTAMESTFLNDIGGDSGELSFRLRLRAARWLSKNGETQKVLFDNFRELYRLCSGAVHKGYIPKKFQTKKQEMLEEGCKQVAKAIELIIYNQGVDWDSIIFS